MIEFVKDGESHPMVADMFTPSWAVRDGVVLGFYTHLAKTDLTDRCIAVDFRNDERAVLKSNIPGDLAHVDACMQIIVRKWFGKLGEERGHDPDFFIDLEFIKDGVKHIGRLPEKTS